MLPVACAGIRPGDEVLDVCSAPGGKAMHALLCLQGKGLLSARDVRPDKVEKIEENIRRMGYRNAHCKVWDGTGYVIWLDFAICTLSPRASGRKK